MIDSHASAVQFPRKTIRAIAEIFAPTHDRSAGCCYDPDSDDRRELKRNRERQRPWPASSRFTSPDTSTQLDEFERFLAAKNNTPDYVQQTTNRIRCLLEASCFIMKASPMSPLAAWNSLSTYLSPKLPRKERGAEQETAEEAISRWLHERFLRSMARTSS